MTLRLPCPFTRKYLIGAVISTALAVAGCGGYSGMMPGGGGAPPPPPAPAASIHPCDTPVIGCAPAASFQIKALRDLNIVINWKNLAAGNHAQTVTFFLPSGELYQTFEKSFAVADSGAATTMEALPVAGTWIRQRNLSGSWRVAVALDGQSIGEETVQLSQ